MVLTLAFMALVAPFTQMAPATTNYVAQGGQTPASPYTSWVTAASNIQDAINQAIAGDTVLVSNGVYEAGGITNYPTGTLLTNRVAIYKAITVRSTNGPAVTTIKGAWDPATNGPAAVRCVYMTNGSTLIGFTLTNGATLTTGTNDKYGGAVWSQSTNTVISNCTLTGNSAKWGAGGVNYGTLFNCTLTRNSAGVYGGGSFYGTLFNCTLTTNSAVYSGGGSYYGILNNCTLTSNSTAYAGGTYGGGGNYFGTLTNCTLIGNSSANNGGGARGGNLFNCTLISNTAVINGGGADGNGTYDCTLSNCTLIGNSANQGGGTINVYLYNCTLTGNRATTGGGGALAGSLINCTIASNSAPSGQSGGAQQATLYNCTLVGNWCNSYGGGARACTLYNCTIVGNSAGSQGGGVSAGTLYNCISWGNNIVDAGAVINYSCGVGYTNGGSVSGNITTDPLFVANGSGYGSGHVAGNYHLRNESPPLNAGTNFSWLADPDVRSKDLDGQRRIDRFSGQVDMGCYELMPRGTMFTFK